MPAFNITDPVVVGLSTKADHYHRVFDNTLALRDGEIALSGQTPLDFVHAVTSTQFGRVAAEALKYPRLNAGGTAWEMNVPTAGVHSLYVPNAALRPTPTGGAGWPEDATSTNPISGMPFDPTTSESAYFWVALPEAWDHGTLTARFYTFNKAGGSGGLVFSLAGLAVGDDEAISTAVGTSQKATDAALAAYRVQIGPATPAITLAGTPAAGDLVLFVVSRLTNDGGDDYGSDVYLHGIKLQLTTTAETDA